VCVCVWVCVCVCVCVLFVCGCLCECVYYVYPPYTRFSNIYVFAGIPTHYCLLSIGSFLSKDGALESLCCQLQVFDFAFVFH
jgi:hypothetical protein